MDTLIDMTGIRVYGPEPGSVLTLADRGGWVPNVIGRYAPGEVVLIAFAWGWADDYARGIVDLFNSDGGEFATFKEWLHDGNEYICDDCDMAEQFMQAFAPDGFYFGTNEYTGDWGLWADNGEEF